MSDSKLAIERAVTGVELPMDQPIVCDDCHARLREGQPITVGASQHGGEVWRIGDLWCAVCAPRPSESDADEIVEGDIGIVSDVREQAHYPVLVRATVCEELVRADGGVRPVTVECSRCHAEVPAAELGPGKGVCRDCWEATKEDLRAYEESKERKRRDRRPMTDGGEPAGYECMLRGCGNENPAGRDDGYCSDRCTEASAEMREALEQTRRAERRAAGEADVLRVEDSR